MRANALWYGFLDAGEKSSPVVFDPRLDTGNPQTIYLFNLQRDMIVPYKREVVDAKLRELGTDEAALIARLKSSYTKARRRSGLRFARPVGDAGQASPDSSQLLEQPEVIPAPELDADLDAVWSEDL